MVCFCDPPDLRQHWTYRPFVRTGFRHVFCLHYDAQAQHWVVCDPSSHTMTIRIADDETVKPLICLAQQTGSIITWRENASLRRPLLPVHCRVQTCVTLVKAVIHYNGKERTPFGLYKGLKKNGGEQSKHGKFL